MRVVVIGAGVSGLTCAVALLEAGIPVDIWADRFSPNTTSNVAAAFWFPYHVRPRHRVLGWARHSHGRFVQLAQEEPDSGVTVRDATEALRNPERAPWWAAAAPDYRAARPQELPPGIDPGWRFSAPVVDTRTYMPWLHARALALGARFVQRRIDDLVQAWDHGDVLIHCTGLGARDLCHDDALRPVRGQLVLVPNPGLTEVIVDEQNPKGVTYVVPRGDDCVLGGSSQPDDEDLEVRPQLAAEIHQRCAALVPALAGAVPIDHRVGLRPVRDEVRLELESAAPSGHIVHNYGHGGAGVTLSWGCAAEVANIVTELQAAMLGPPVASPARP